jgi:hypothetical protein
MLRMRFHLSIHYLSVHMSIYLFACLSVHYSVSLSLHHCVSDLPVWNFSLYWTTSRVYGEASPRDKSWGVYLIGKYSSLGTFPVDMKNWCSPNLTCPCWFSYRFILIMIWYVLILLYTYIFIILDEVLIKTKIICLECSSLNLTISLIWILIYMIWIFIY